MQVFRGKIILNDVFYDALQVRSGEHQVITVYLRQEILWIHYEKSRLYDEAPMVTELSSSVFPKITDFFPKNLASIMVTFKNEKNKE